MNTPGSFQCYKALTCEPGYDLTDGECTGEKVLRPSPTSASQADYILGMSLPLPCLFPHIPALAFFGMGVFVSAYLERYPHVYLLGGIGLSQDHLGEEICLVEYSVMGNITLRPRVRVETRPASPLSFPNTCWPLC